MNMVISGNHSLDQLQEWVTSKFNAVPNKDVVLPDLSKPAPPFTVGENLSKIVRFKPVKDEDRLTLFYILPNYQMKYKTKPLNYFSHLFGHEGENSLFSYLKEEDLIMTLSAGGDHEMDCFSTFEIDMQLTAKGLKNYKQVLVAIFKYADKLFGVDKQPSQAVFDEVKEVGKLKFNFLEKNDPMEDCIGHARNMIRFKSDMDMKHLIRH